MTTSHKDRSQRYRRECEILRLVAAGYLDKQIVKKMKCHHRTVARLRLQVTNIRRCECGQPFYHSNKCRRKPGWQAVARERRDAFDDLLIRINRRVPATLPEEMRADICQEMLLAMMESIESVLENVPSFIKGYKRLYPFQYHSLDAKPALIEQIAG